MASFMCDLPSNFLECYRVANTRASRFVFIDVPVSFGRPCPAFPGRIPHRTSQLYSPVWGPCHPISQPCSSLHRPGGCVTTVHVGHKSQLCPCLDVHWAAAPASHHPSLPT
eukprot:scaffold2859_cov349-Pavlova_lutheri.AAC.75